MDKTLLFPTVRERPSNLTASSESGGKAEKECRTNRQGKIDLSKCMLIHPSHSRCQHSGANRGDLH